MDLILTQWDFHRVQEHLKRSSDEEVMTFRSWRSHMTRQSYLDNLPYFPGSSFPARSSTHYPQRNPDGILTQWGFHRVLEHQKRSSDEEVMTFRSWRSHMTRQSYPDSLPYLPGSPFPDRSSTHYHPKAYGWNIYSMGFP